MNILVLTNEYPYEKYPRANWTKVVAYFANEWVKMGHRVIAIVNTSTFPMPYYAAAKIAMKLGQSKRLAGTGLSDTTWTQEFSFNDNGVEVFNLPMEKYSAGGKYSNKALKQQVERITKLLEANAFKPDVITGHWLNPQLYLVGELKTYYGVKGTCVFHGDYSQERCEKFHANELMKKVDHIGFRSASAVKMASKYLNFPFEPFVCCSGVPDEFIAHRANAKEKTFSEKSYKVISAGRLVPYKCFGVTISATAKAFKGMDYSFEIAGDGAEFETLETVISSEDANEKIKMIGKIQREELQTKMRDSDIFVLISKNETFGLVYLEAMLQGCIVIASKYGGVDGIIRDGYNGFLCEEGSEEDLIKIYKKITSLTIFEKKKISAAAVKTAMDFTDSKVATRYLQEMCR